MAVAAKARRPRVESAATKITQLRNEQSTSDDKGMTAGTDVAGNVKKRRREGRKEEERDEEREIERERERERNRGRCQKKQTR